MDFANYNLIIAADRAKARCWESRVVSTSEPARKKPLINGFSKFHRRCDLTLAILLEMFTNVRLVFAENTRGLMDSLQLSVDL